MEPGLVLTTFVNLEVLVEHRMDVGVTMLEDEPSLFHAQNARTGAERLHRCDGVALPLDVYIDQGSNLIDMKPNATGVVRDVQVIGKMRRESSRRHITTTSLLPSDLEMTIEAFLQARLRLANVDLVVNCINALHVEKLLPALQIDLLIVGAGWVVRSFRCRRYLAGVSMICSV